MSEEQKKLEIELQIAYEEDAKRFRDAPLNMNFQEFKKYMSSTSDKVSKISRKLRLIKKPTYSELSNYGDVMTLDHFIENVKSGGFIDYDGYGLYVKDDKETDIEIYPSDIKYNSVRSDFNTIIWFNR